MLGSLRPLGSCWQLWWPNQSSGFPYDRSQMHTSGSWAWSHCLHEVSHRPLMRHPGTHSSPIHPSQTLSPYPGSTNTNQQLGFCRRKQQCPWWQPRTTNTRNWKQVFVFLKLSLVPSAVSKSKCWIFLESAGTESSLTAFSSQLLGNPVFPGACLRTGMDRNLYLCSTWYSVLVTWFCWYHEAASLLIKQNNSLRHQNRPSFCAYSFPALPRAADLALDTHPNSYWFPPTPSSSLRPLNSFPLANRYVWHKPQLQLPLQEHLSHSSQTQPPPSAPTLCSHVSRMKRPSGFKSSLMSFWILSALQRRISVPQHRQLALSQPNCSSAVMDGVAHKASSWGGGDLLGQRPLQAATWGPANLITLSPSPRQGVEVAWIWPSL